MGKIGKTGRHHQNIKQEEMICTFIQVSANFPRYFKIIIKAKRALGTRLIIC